MRKNLTQMGGINTSFMTTQWSRIEAARTLDPEHQKRILEDLIGAYWKPVYCYIRRKGYDNDKAKDLTQGFFHEVVLGRQLIQTAEQTRGRFRTLLLTALDRYMTSAYRRETAAKRQPQAGLLSWEELEESYGTIQARELDPQAAFTYAWASQLLQKVLVDLEKACRQDDKATHWELFRIRVLDPIISGTDPVPLAELCKRFGLPDPVKAKNMVVTIKRRFQSALRTQVRQWVNLETEVDEEIRVLMQILSG